MHILIVSDSYPPEIRSASHLMQELAEGLVKRNYNVTVVTSYPQYNLSEEHKGKIFNEYLEEDGVKVIRVKTLPHHNVNFIIRGISQLTMPYIFFNKIKKYVRKIDAIIVYSPPLPLSIVGARVKKIFRAKFILNVQDLFPQNAIDLGILKNPFLITFFKKLEYYAYKEADVVTFHSEGNFEFVKRTHPKFEGKFRVIHNWVDVSEFEKADRTGKFRQKFNIDNKFILLFAGVIGPSQGLDFIIKLAKRVNEIEDICFLIVGDGMERDRLKNMVRKLRINNVLFKPFIPKNEYPSLVKDCDIGLVSLTDKNKTPVVPGKILGYMAAGMPILAFLNKESDGHNIIKDAKCGYSCVWGDLEKAEELLKKMYLKRDELPILGRNGYKYVKANYDREKIIDKIVELINE